MPTTTTYDARKAYEVRARIAAEIIEAMANYLAAEDGLIDGARPVDPDSIHWGDVGSMREAVNHLAEAARMMLGDRTAALLVGSESTLDARIGEADLGAGVRGTKEGEWARGGAVRS